MYSVRLLRRSYAFSERSLFQSCCAQSILHIPNMSNQPNTQFSTSSINLRNKTNRDKIFVFDSTKRPSLELDEKVAEHLRNGKLLGRSKPLVVQPPEKIVNAMAHVLQNSKRNIYDHLEEYMGAGNKLFNVLEGRHPPLKEKYGQRVISVVEQTIRKQFEPMMKEAELESVLYNQLELETEIQKRIKEKVKKMNSYWKQIQYDDENAVWAYALGKSMYDYSCMFTVMKEITKRVPLNQHQPRTLLDFGSGVGTSIWAALEIFGTMNEVFAVDTSPKMNDFARLLLQGGNEQARLPAGYFFRLHLPRESEVRYDLVTCSFTLLDLASERERLVVVDNLWKKTEHFLILIEVGSNAGFQVLSEARHYLTNVCKAAEVEAIDNCEEPSKSELMGHIFAPCPNEGKCPRYHQDNIPCNFDVNYRSMYFDKMPKVYKEDFKQKKFSYLIFRKGPRTADCSWPRLVSTPLARNNHVVCRFCTASAKLQEYVATNTKNDKEQRIIYKYAKRLQWGEQMKAHVIDHPDDNAENLNETVPDTELADPLRTLDIDFPQVDKDIQESDENLSLALHSQEQDTLPKQQDSK